MSAVLKEALLIIIRLFIGKIMETILAARYTGHFDWSANWMISFGMLVRAELVFLVTYITYVQHQLITTDIFFYLILTTVPFP